jgi:F-type H+/Na+-transporting ATPase subunit alpha
MSTVNIREIGQIKEIKKSVARVSGFLSCMNGELLDITANTKGMVMGFVEEEALVLLLGKTQEVKVGDNVYSRMEAFRIPVGEAYLGRVVNALAEPVDGKGPIQYAGFEPGQYYPIFRDAPGVLDRIPLTEVFPTGIMSIDSIIPIGKGQRELIVGDRMTGKTSLCLDAILNQKGRDVVCIYCCIGRSLAALENVIESLKDREALDYTIIVSAPALSSVGEQYMAPYTACTLGEYFMYNGQDVFVVFDDLTKHAWAYRQISLLLERSPGRDAYPGDIFYLHSQLMERAGKLNPEFKSGSMTFFPIVDTPQGDITGYIPSNLVSMTDGQIYLNAGLFSSGFKPAIDLGLSVSRIGNKVQCQAMKDLSAMLRLDYVQYLELIKLTRFKTKLAEEASLRLKHGEVMTQIFIQDKFALRSLEEEIILLYALKRYILDVLTSAGINYFKENIFEFARKNHPEMVKALTGSQGLTPEINHSLDECFSEFFRDKEIYLSAT